MARGRIVRLAAAVLLAATLAVFLCACNRTEDLGGSEYCLKIVDINVDDETYKVNVSVAFTNDENGAVCDQKATWNSQIGDINAFFRQQDIQINMPAEALYEAVYDDALKELEKQDKEGEYRMCVWFRYDTNYKSIKSDGTKYRTGLTNYTHMFDLDRELEEQELHMSLKLPRSESWYGVLIACGLALFAVLMTIAAVIAKSKKSHCDDSENGQAEFQTYNDDDGSRS